MIDITKIEDDALADKEGVDRFAAAMHAKMTDKRLQGYSGWHNDCTTLHLLKLLNEHLPKGDMLDVANFAMMIWNREHPTAVSARPEALCSGWVPISERAPERDGKYFVLVGDYHEALASKYYRWNGNYCWEYAYVTHWMSVPALSSLPSPLARITGEPIPQGDEDK